jgi:hypothetical protein
MAAAPEKFQFASETYWEAGAMNASGEFQLAIILSNFVIR